MKNIRDVLDSTSEQVSIMKTASFLTSLKAKIKLAQRKETGSCFVIWKRFVKYMFLIIRYFNYRVLKNIGLCIYMISQKKCLPIYIFRLFEVMEMMLKYFNTLIRRDS